MRTTALKLSKQFQKDLTKIYKACLSDGSQGSEFNFETEDGKKLSCRIMFTKLTDQKLKVSSMYGRMVSNENSTNLKK